MKILFVYRGYETMRSNSVVDFQRDALLTDGCRIDSFAFCRGGLKGYFNAWKQLRKTLKNQHFDILHAHYSFSGFIAALATRKPVICSLMGSDLFNQCIILKFITRFFYAFLWKKVVVKSIEMKKILPRSILIPNGVDLSNFRETSKREALNKTAFDANKKNIIFVAQDPESNVKNIKLVKKALSVLDDDNICLNIVSGKTFEELPYYYNGADMLILTSLSEGSPNVIKEAMACNCPIVATDVGDVKEVIGDTEGCYLTSFDPVDVAKKIQKALAFGKRTNGREKIKRFDSKLIAKQIIEVYENASH